MAAREKFEKKEKLSTFSTADFFSDNAFQALKLFNDRISTNTTFVPVQNSGHEIPNVQRRPAITVYFQNVIAFIDIILFYFYAVYKIPGKYTTKLYSMSESRKQER